jgi:hypothetical protein
MHIQFTDQQIHDKAVELQLIYPSQELPRNLRSSVVSALIQQEAQGGRPAGGGEPQLAKEIVIQPGGVILVDGEPFPWIVTNEPMQINLATDGPSTVRLTLASDAVQIIKPEPREESE